MSIMRSGDHMPLKRTGGKLEKGVIVNRGKTIAQDSAKGSAPANFVRPKATATPSKPAKKD